MAVHTPASKCYKVKKKRQEEKVDIDAKRRQKLAAAPLIQDSNKLFYFIIFYGVDWGLRMSRFF